MANFLDKSCTVCVKNILIISEVRLSRVVLISGDFPVKFNYNFLSLELTIQC